MDRIGRTESVDRAGAQAMDAKSRSPGTDRLLSIGLTEPLEPRSGMSHSVAQLYDTGNPA